MAPLVAAWYAGVNLTSTPKVSMMSLKRLETKQLPLSEIAVLGTPYLETHCMKAFATSAEFGDDNG